jgi:hypothetical protein
MTFVLDTTSDEYNQQVSSDKEIDFDSSPSFLMGFALLDL